jgi:hypothetical protein
MTESRLESKLSVGASAPRRLRHLVRRGQSWRSQMRVPADLNPLRKMSAPRVNLGPPPIRSAERKARAGDGGGIRVRTLA